MSGPTTYALAKLLQVPENATKAVLVLQGGKVPTLHITREIHDAGDWNEPMRFTHKFILQPADLRTAVQIQCDEARARVHTGINEASRRAKRDLARLAERNRKDHLYATEVRPWIHGMAQILTRHEAERNALGKFSEAVAGLGVAASSLRGGLGFYSSPLGVPYKPRGESVLEWARRTVQAMRRPRNDAMDTKYFRDDLIDQARKP